MAENGSLSLSLSHSLTHAPQWELLPTTSLSSNSFLSYQQLPISLVQFQLNPPLETQLYTYHNRAMNRFSRVTSIPSTAVIRRMMSSSHEPPKKVFGHTGRYAMATYTAASKVMMKPPIDKSLFISLVQRFGIVLMVSLWCSTNNISSDWFKMAFLQ